MPAFLEKIYVRIPFYIAFGVVVFLMAVALTFPDDELKDIVAVQMEKNLGPEYQVSITELDLWWLTGLELHEVTIEERVAPDEADASSDEEAEAKKGGDDAEQEGLPKDLPMKVTLTRVAGRLSLLGSLFNLAPTVEFETDIGDGVIGGTFQQGSDGRRLEVEIDDVDLRKSTLLTGLLGVPFFGNLEGEIDLGFHPKKNLVTDGTIDITGNKVTIGPATVKTDKFPPMTYFEIPQTNFGTLTIDMKVEGPEKGRPSLEIAKFKASGRDVRAEIWGSIQLGGSVKAMRSRLKARLQFDASFVEKNNLAPLLNVNQFRRGKAKDWYGFEIYGRMSRIQFKGSKAAANGPSGDPGKPSAGKPKGKPSPGKPSSGKPKGKPSAGKPKDEPKSPPKGERPKSPERPKKK